MALYDAYGQGKKAVLPEQRFQYADYAVWQREWLQGNVLESGLAYWRQQLADAQILDIPTDYSRTLAVSDQGKTLIWEFPQELYRDLKQVSRKHGVTLFMTLLAGFQVLLSQYSGQRDISVGTPIAGRTLPETEKMIGLSSVILWCCAPGSASVSIFRIYFCR